jgi:hypothetical protein
MLLGKETKAADNLLFFFAQGFIGKLEESAASPAHHVSVAGLIIVQRTADEASQSGDPVGKVKVAKKFQRAIYGHMV